MIIDLKKFNSNKFLLYSSVLGQLATIAFTPFITRFETKSEIGLYAIFFSCVAIYSLIGGFRIELGLIEHKGKSNIEKKMLASTVLCLALFTSFLFILVLQLIYNKFIFSILVFFGCLLTILSITLTYWTISGNDIKNVVFFRFSKPIFIVIFQLYFILNDTEMALIIGYNIGISIALLIFIKKIIQFRIPTLIIFISKIKQNINFIKFSTPSDFLNSLGTQLPTFVFERVYGLEFSASYLYTQRLVISPFAMITESLSKTYFQLYSLKENFNDFISEILTLQIKFYILVFGGIILFDELIVSILFGNNWDEMNFLIKGSFFWVLSVFISVPVLSLLSITKNQKIDFKFQITLFVFRLLALSLIYFTDSFNIIFIVFCFASGLPYLIFLRKTLNVLSLKIDINKLYSIKEIINIAFILIIGLLMRPNIDLILYYLICSVFVLVQLSSVYKKFTKLNMDI